MEVDTYLSWVKEVNLEASKLGKCLSCYTLNSRTLTGYYQEGVTPIFVMVKLALDKREKNKCICKQKRLK